jgi:tRNA pseudouridine65 synthase
VPEPLPILYRDLDLVAICKPSGLVVHRSEHATDRVNTLTLLRDQLGRRVHPVHRLDRGASGALLFALDPDLVQPLSAAFARREVDKAYLAVVRGFAPEATTIDSPVSDDGGGRAQPAETRLRRLGSVELPHSLSSHPTTRYSLVEAVPLTGRTHQIRRHLAHIRHPIVGDVTHGDGRHNRFFREHFGVRRLLLHARTLAFVHPRTGLRVQVVAPLPDELERLFRALSFPLEVLPGRPAN